MAGVCLLMAGGYLLVAGGYLLVDGGYLLVDGGYLLVAGLPPGGGLIFPTDPRQEGGQERVVSGRRGSSVRFKVSGIFARLYRSKYQLFIFSEGFSRAKPVHRGNGNCT